MISLTTLILSVLGATGLTAGLPWIVRLIGRGVINNLGPKLEKRALGKLSGKLKRLEDKLGVQLPTVPAAPATPQTPQYTGPVPVPPAQGFQVPVLDGKVYYDHYHQWIPGGDYPKQVIKHQSEYVPFEAPNKELDALKKAMDKLVQQYPAQVGTVDMLRSYAKQIEAGQ